MNRTQNISFLFYLNKIYLFLVPRMTGAQWASQDQTEFLWSFISDYYKVNKGDRNYVPFWSRLREKWFERYPEHEALFPDKEEDDLLPDEEAQVTENIQARVKVTKSFRFDVTFLTNLEIFSNLKLGSDGE